MSKIPPPPPKGVTRTTRSTHFAPKRVQATLARQGKRVHHDDTVALRRHDHDDRPRSTNHVQSNFVAAVSGYGPGLPEFMAEKRTTRDRQPPEYVGQTVRSLPTNRWSEASKD